MAADGPGHLCDRKDIQGRQGQLPDDRFAALVAEELERTCRWPSRLMGIAEPCRAPLLIYQAQLPCAVFTLYDILGADLARLHLGFDHVLPELRSPAFESAAK
jgi:hypothetical protein